jgi:DNA-binding winged helix-turn-helix (wHTH) protein
VNKCPCCGSAVEVPAIVDLDLNVIAVGGKSVRVRPQCAELVHVLVEAYPAGVAYERIFMRLHGAANEPNDPKNSLSAQLVYLRRLLKQVGVKIVSEWGFGLRLQYDEPANRAA